MKLTCITCPRSCDITLEEKPDGSLDVSGNKCKRGLEYAESEYRAPMRMLTTTVTVLFREGHRRLPVISSQPVPKQRLEECLQRLYKLSVKSPVAMGDVIDGDILGTGADILAARSIGVDKQ